MIRYNFDRVFKARGIERPFSYLRQAGFSDNFATKVKNNRVVRLNLKELEKLCLVLRCTPNDFCEWIKEKDTQVDSDHPINLIKRSDKVVDIIKTLNTVPLGQLDEIEGIIKEKIKATTHNAS